MISFRDYFDEEKVDDVYVSSEEYVADLLKVVDMIVEKYKSVRDHKRNSTFYSLPPALRYSQETDFDFCNEVSDALDYISNRTEGDSPFEEISGMLGLSRYCELAVLLALSVEADAGYAKIFSELMEYDTDYPSIGLLDNLYTVAFGSKTEGDIAAFRNFGIMPVFFFDIDEDDRIPRSLMPLRLYADMAAYLLGGYSLEYAVMNEEDNEIFRKIDQDHMGRDLLSRHLGTIEREIRDDTERTPIVLLLGENKLEKECFASLLAEEYETSAFSINIDFYNAQSKEQKKIYIHKTVLRLVGVSRVLLMGSASKESLLSADVNKLIKTINTFCANAIILVDHYRERQYEEDGSERTENLTGEFFRNAGRVEMHQPDVDERVALWKEGLAGAELDENVDLFEVGECYELGYDAIVKISEQICSDCTKGFKPKVTTADIKDEINDRSTVAFGSLATRLEANYTWEDIEIDERQKGILQLACNRYKHRNRIYKTWGIGKKGAYGNGVSVLLYGPPGTGKTMAAQVVAKEIGLPLYRVDLAQLSSKYIGETEKNLSKVFDEAARSNVILFFDEADAVFSKRTEVDSSNDKYANTESAFLLQKLEAYNGFVVLATNLFNNFDNAFVRRLTYAISLDSPDAETRIKLFKLALPKEVPLDERIDFELYGNKFELSGSNIKAIMNGACYLALIEGTGLKNRHIVVSMCYEYKKLGKMIPVSDFGAYGSYCI